MQCCEIQVAGQMRVVCGSEGFDILVSMPAEQSAKNDFSRQPASRRYTENVIGRCTSGTPVPVMKG